MEKEQLIEQMLKVMGDKNNIIDLDAYAKGLIDMYDKVVLPQANVSGNAVAFSAKDMENFAAKMLLIYNKEQSLKKELEIFCENDR